VADEIEYAGDPRLSHRPGSAWRTTSRPNLRGDVRKGGRSFKRNFSTPTSERVSGRYAAAGEAGCVRGAPTILSGGSDGSGTSLMNPLASGNVEKVIE